MKLFGPNATDFYKTGHIFQYPKGSKLVYSNLTNRSSSLANMTKDFDNRVVNFGLQGALKEITEMWNDSFFSQPKEKALARYQRRMDNALGPGAITIDHMAALHDLGYLPVLVKALPEGSLVDIKVPTYTIRNTHDDFYWVTNYLETVLSAMTWKSQTVATIAYQYKKMLERYAKNTGGYMDFVPWQGHDFSNRGMSGMEDAARSGAAHLAIGFTGTDTISAIDYLEDYYGANSDKELIGGSVPATEHSVMCAGSKEGETETIRRLITELYPSGVVSIVSDTWDFFNVITNVSVVLKNEILNRKPNGLGLAKVVFRPDSGNPTKIVCGDPTATPGSPEFKGAIECLWDVFGGTVNKQGFRILNPRVGLIYGDSITLQRAEAILSGLAEKKFSSSNVVFGIGSFTYQYMTRDTFGSAIKATYFEDNTGAHNLFKDPKTDSGVKKSAEGMLRVEKENGHYVLYDKQTWEQEDKGELKQVYYNGKITHEITLSDVRKTLNV